MMLRKLSKFCLGLFALAFCVSSCSVEAKYKRKFKFCKLDNLIECFAEPIAQFTSQPNGTGIAANEQEFEQYCFNNHDYMPYCVRQWSKRCGSQIQVEVIKRMFTDPMQESMKQFCDTKGTLRPFFLKHSQCLISNVKLATSYRSACVREMQANNEYIHDMQMQHPNATSFMGSFCCAYNKWERCIMSFMVDKCGEESAKIVPDLIHHTTMDLLKGICPQTRYDPTNPEACPPQRFEAPKDYQPKGYGSNSLISYYFSYLCPNVGWGVGNNDF